MKATTLLASVLVVALMLLSGLAAFAPKTGATGPTITTINLPHSSVPVGLQYASSCLWYASYSAGFVMCVNPSLNSYSNFTTSTGNFNRYYYGMAVDASGNLWLTRRDVGNDGTLPGVSRIDTAGAYKAVINGSSGQEWNGIGYSDGYVYAAAQDTLYKVSTASPYSVTQFPVPGTHSLGEGYYGMVADSSGNIWFSDINSGKLCEFNGSSVSCWSGFSRPLGVAAKGLDIAVAEKNANGNIDFFNPSTDAMVNQTAETGTTPYDVSVIPGPTVFSPKSLVFTSSGSDDQICAYGGSCVNTGDVNYYLATSGSGAIYYSFDGSGVGEISGPTNSTTTSTSIVTSTTTLTESDTAIATVTSTITNTHTTLATVTSTVGTVTVTTSATTSTMSTSSTSATSTSTSSTTSTSTTTSSNCHGKSCSQTAPASPSTSLAALFSSSIAWTNQNLTTPLLYLLIAVAGTVIGGSFAYRSWGKPRRAF